MRALARSHRQSDPEKQNVPPFRGGTWEHSMRTAIAVNRSRDGKPAPLTFRCRGKIQLQCSGDGTVDAPTRTLAPETRHIVACPLLGTTSRAAVLILEVQPFGVHVRRASCAR